MLIKRVNFSVVVKQYNFKILYYKKRTIKPFEFVLLKLADELPIDNIKLNDFLTNYLQIPLADKILKDYLSWLIENGYLEQINENLNFIDLNLDDLKITSKGKKVLKENFFPSEQKIFEGNYAINPLTREYISKKNLLDKPENEVLELNFNIDFSKDWIKQNLKRFIILEEQDKVENIEYVSENNMFIEMSDEIILKDNNLISKKFNIAIPLNDEIEEKYNNIVPIEQFDINKFLSSFDVEKIKNNNSSIKFEVYDENENYIIKNDQLRIVFNAPKEEEIYEDTKIGSIIFLKNNFPIENCIYLDDNKNSIFASNLQIKYYDSSIILFKYFSIKNFEFNINDFLQSIEIKSILSKLLFKKKEEVLNEILQDKNLNINDKIVCLKKIFDYKNQPFDYKNLLESYLEKNKDYIDYNLFLIVIDEIPISFLNTSISIENILTNLIQGLDSKKLTHLYNKVKSINKLFQIFKDAINKLYELDPNNEIINNVKTKFDKKKKKRNKKKKKVK